MTEWRFRRRWSAEALRERLDRLQEKRLNFAAVEEEMTGADGWHHYYSEAVIVPPGMGEDTFERARVALAGYQFSNPAIVEAHFDPKTPLEGRRLLLEIKVLGLHYLCPAVVNRVRDEAEAYGFRYDTLDGHIERGVEWFLLTRDLSGAITFRIEARWQRGVFPNWWSRLGFMTLAGYFQRRWHRQAHQRLSLLAHYGSLKRPPTDAAGLAHQGVDVTFTYLDERK